MLYLLFDKSTKDKKNFMVITALQQFRIDVHDDVFQVGVDIQGFRSGFPRAVAGLLQPAERHMGLAAVSSGIDDSHARSNILSECDGPVEAAGVNTGGKAVG